MKAQVFQRWQVPVIALSGILMLVIPALYIPFPEVLKYWALTLGFLSIPHLYPVFPPSLIPTELSRRIGLALWILCFGLTLSAGSLRLLQEFFDALALIFLLALPIPRIGHFFVPILLSIVLFFGTQVALATWFHAAGTLWVAITGTLAVVLGFLAGIPIARVFRTQRPGVNR